jgi:hypothetical protein
MIKFIKKFVPVNKPKNFSHSHVNKKIEEATIKKLQFVIKQQKKKEKKEIIQQEMDYFNIILVDPEEKLSIINPNK